ncbi:MAG: hypothetical protein JKP90_00275 [Desulfofustis sp. PB-SRB1]|nr:hypothetical protein [Desulfofustis sp. PB-SRB1]
MEDEALRTEVALFRFGVISELVASRLEPGELTELIYQKVSSTGISPALIAPGCRQPPSGAGCDSMSGRPRAQCLDAGQAVRPGLSARSMMRLAAP